MTGLTVRGVLRVASAVRAIAVVTAASGVAGGGVTGEPPAAARRGSFEDLVDSRRAVEAVRWSHRLWPDSNPGPKPSLSEVLPDDRLRERVDDGLRKAHALEQIFERPLTRRDLQDELDRIARDSKDRGRLAETWAALANDAAWIAETEVRPALADRLLRERYAADPRFQGAAKAGAEAAARGAHDVSDLSRAGGSYVESVLRIDRDADARILRGLSGAFGQRGSVRPDPRRWRRTVSRVIEDSEGFHVVAILARGEGWIRLATVTWPKTPFDSWWESVRGKMPPTTFAPDPTLRLPALPDASGCAPDSWSRMDPGMPTPRQSHTAVWTGSEMIVWGGVEGDWLREGWRYDPAADTWTPMSSAGAPAARAGHLAVWTGTAMLVWGGEGASGPAPGGRYDPAADRWSPMSAAGEPAGHLDASAVWTGTEMIVWGGDDGGSTFYATGARYRPSTDAWTATSNVGAPSARGGHTAVWSGGTMIVWGGTYYDSTSGDVYVNSGGVYDPSSDTWTPTRAQGAPAPRTGHTAVWTGSRMLVWGGVAFDATTGAATYYGDGAQYDPASDRWTAMSSSGAPSAREGHRAVWTGSVMIVWGGRNDAAELADGGRYDPSANAWSPVSAAGSPGAREEFTAVWTGSRMVVWGGSDGYDPLDSGGRYDPAANTWASTRKTSTRPERRYGQAAVWTGSELLEFGGETNRSFMQSTFEAFRYDPSTDAWRPAASTTLQGPRWFETAVWSGSQAILWGGQNLDPAGNARCLAGGLRYDPTADAWSSASTAGQPDARCFHTAVWTGRQMVIWGGSNPALFTYFDTGGLYDPLANAWSPTTTSGAPSSRSEHTAVWSGHEMIVWGGQGSAGTEPAFRQSGGRYDPGADRWAPTALAGAPSGRYRQSATWSGREMLVWGGGADAGTPIADGARYDPLRDAWRPMTTTGAPGSAERAAFTCGRLVAWGGGTTSGGVYDPVSDVWTPTANAAGVYAHADFPLVPTGNTVLAWSGSSAADTTNTGASYCVCASQPLPGSPWVVVDRASKTTSRVAWEVLPQATSYDLVRGSLAALRSTNGSFGASTTGCLANDSTTSAYDDAAPPDDGGSWYLVRANSAAGAGSYDDGSPSQSGSRDAGIAASGAACP